MEENQNVAKLRHQEHLRKKQIGDLTQQLLEIENKHKLCMYNFQGLEKKLTHLYFNYPLRAVNDFENFMQLPLSDIALFEDTQAALERFLNEYNSCLLQLYSNHMPANKNLQKESQEIHVAIQGFLSVAGGTDQTRFQAYQLIFAKIQSLSSKFNSIKSSISHNYLNELAKEFGLNKANLQKTLDKLNHVSTITLQTIEEEEKEEKKESEWDISIDMTDLQPQQQSSNPLARLFRVPKSNEKTPLLSHTLSTAPYYKYSLIPKQEPNKTNFIMSLVTDLKKQLSSKQHNQDSNTIAFTDENLLHILSNLNDKDLRTLARVCNYLNNFSKDNNLWKNLAITKFPNFRKKIINRKAADHKDGYFKTIYRNTSLHLSGKRLEGAELQKKLKMIPHEYGSAKNCYLSTCGILAVAVIEGIYTLLADDEDNRGLYAFFGILAVAGLYMVCTMCSALQTAIVNSIEENKTQDDNENRLRHNEAVQAEYGETFDSENWYLDDPEQSSILKAFENNN